MTRISDELLDRAFSRDRNALPKQDPVPPASLQPSLRTSAQQTPQTFASTVAMSATIAPFKIVLVACLSVAAGAAAFYLLPTSAPQLAPKVPAAPVVNEMPLPDPPPTQAPYAQRTGEPPEVQSHIADQKRGQTGSYARPLAPEVSPSGALLIPTTPPKTYLTSKAALQVRDRDSTARQIRETDVPR